jgi:outer membrane protein assembly factor BamB
MRTLAIVAIASLASATQADDWPQWRGPNRDGVWREAGIIDRFDADRLEGDRIKRLWRAPISSGYSGPTVAAGRVFVTDYVTRPKEVERIHAFSEATGEPLWTHTYDCTYADIDYKAGPRAAVTVVDGVAFALGAVGHFHALDAKTGDVLYQKDLRKEYKIRMPGWGISAAPLVEKDLVILHVGGEGACLVAFDRKTGKERWRALDDKASYSAPIVIDQAGRRVLVCWTGENVVGLNPATGDVLWKYPFKPTRMVISIVTPVVDQERLFVSSFYDGSLLLKLSEDKPEVKPIWRRLGQNEHETDSLHAILSTPILSGDYIYGVDSYGQLRCLDAKTGDRIWENQTATPKERWGTIHMVRNGERVWMFNERGELIIATLSPEGFKEISRAKLIDPTRVQLSRRSGVCWSHPAYANKHIFARNDEELVSASLAK